MELLILYACVQFYTPRASDYRLNSKTELYVERILIINKNTDNYL